MSTNEEPRTESASSAPSPAGIGSLVHTIQFGWFAGHVLTVASGVFYLVFSFPLFKSVRLALFLYRLAFTAVAGTFGINIYQTYRGQVPAVASLSRNVNFHYLLIALLWLVSRPLWMALLPFLVFSLLHSLGYLQQILLPTLGYPANGLPAQIGAFRKAQGDRLTHSAANFEFLTELFLLVRFITFRKGSFLPFIFYTTFIKLRHDDSPHTRAVVSRHEVMVDNLLSHPSLPPVIKQVWIQIKDIIRTASRFISMPGGSTATAAKKAK